MRFTRRTDRTQHIVILKAMVYYSEKIWSRISEGKSTQGEVWRNPGTSVQESFPVESHRTCPILPVTIVTTQEKLSIMEAH